MEGGTIEVQLPGAERSQIELLQKTKLYKSCLVDNVRSLRNVIVVFGQITAS